jgi:hypothetical protein
MERGRLADRATFIADMAAANSGNDKGIAKLIDKMKMQAESEWPTTA